MGVSINRGNPNIDPRNSSILTTRTPKRGPSIVLSGHMMGHESGNYLRGPGGWGIWTSKLQLSEEAGCAGNQKPWSPTSEVLELPNMMYNV